MDDYFRHFEHRRPPPPLPYSARREALWQILATIAALLGRGTSGGVGRSR
ncbi:hypothetical protein ACFSYD_09740 [Paracoccus aerius]